MLDDSTHESWSPGISSYSPGEAGSSSTMPGTAERTDSSLKNRRSNNDDDDRAELPRMISVFPNYYYLIDHN
jgi:hypothetical protein